MTKKTVFTAIISIAFSMVAGLSPTSAANLPEETGNHGTIPSVPQAKTVVTGTVSDASGSLVGATIMEKGNQTGCVTDVDGKFTLSVNPGATLVISFIGYLPQEVKADGSKPMRIQLKEDSQSLEEVVVVGYGVQKKKLVTGANLQVDGDEIQRQNSASVFGALQTMAPGVSITQSSGQVGESYKVNIRGLGTTGSSDPLYVIDGVPGGNLDDLNASDIESIDVLKDAASAAIYGARAANGVILVTTKQGKISDNQKVSVSYDGYIGVQNVITNGVKPLNAKQYMETINKALVSNGEKELDFESLLSPGLYQKIQSGQWNGTNWFKESKNKNASIQNHSLNIMTSNSRSAFSMGFSYFDQVGTLGKPATPEFRRITARLNSSHVLLKRGSRDIVRFGENVTYSNRKKRGVRIGGIYDNHIKNLLTFNPLMPAYNAQGDFYVLKDMQADGWNFDTSIANPLAKMSDQNKDKEAGGNRIQSNFYLEIKPINGLTIRSNAGYHYNQWANRSYVPQYEWDTKNSQPYDVVSQSQGHTSRWSVENTINYANTFGSHSVDVLVGHSLEKWGYGEDVGAKNINSLFPGSFDHAYIGNTQGITEGKTEVSGAPNTEGSLASFFGRINYNYKEKYMASVVLRADGSSNFKKGNQWGYFPSVSAGWVMTNENFMKNTNNWLDFLKIRGSWGQNGNADIAGFQYLATIAFDNTSKYYFDDKNNGSTGGYPDILPNEDVTWETSEQLDFGLDARLFRQRLNLAFDWYKKTTKDWLVVAPQLLSYGTGAPYINGGDVENKGFELSLNWRDQIRKFGYSVGINLSHNKNEVTRIANNEGIIHGPTDIIAQNTTEMYRAEVGKPIGYFWGYKTAGVFQNQKQIDDFIAAGGVTIQKNPQPGDLIFVDRDGNGKFDKDDKTEIGNPHPDFNLGVNIALTFAGFDLSVNGYGAFGQDIIRCYRQFSNQPNDNYTTEVYSKYWNGEGSTNKYPRFSHGKSENFNEINDSWVEKGNYFKISNITLGYDFASLLKAISVRECRLFVKAQNIATITNYSGMDPEVGYGGDDSWSSGIDVGYYPSSRAFLFGLSLTF